jgi:hypothetical protein
VAKRLGRVIDAARAKRVPTADGADGGLADACAAFVYRAYSDHRQQAERRAGGGEGGEGPHGGGGSSFAGGGEGGGGALELDFADLVPRGTRRGAFLVGDVVAGCQNLLRWSEIPS